MRHCYRELLFCASVDKESDLLSCCGQKEQLALSNVLKQEPGPKEYTSQESEFPSISTLKGEAIVSAPAFFQLAGRGNLKFWGEDDGPTVVV